jgi:hypothetical protein
VSDEWIEGLPEADDEMLALGYPPRLTVGELATAWLLDYDIRVVHLSDDDPVVPDESNLWAEDIFEHLVAVDPDLAWRTTEAIVALATDDQLGYVIAGPVEDLLSGWPHLLPGLEALAARDGRFHEALSGIYPLFMTDETYARVRAASAWPLEPAELDERWGRSLADERRREAEDWQATKRARRLEHMASGHAVVSEVTVDGEGRTRIRLAPGATDRDARDIWCDLVVPVRGYDASSTVVVDERDRRRHWPAPRDCSDPMDVPKAIRERKR